MVKPRMVTNPPEKGSFPLDHLGECRDAMKVFRECLETHNQHMTPCQGLAQRYLACRMDHGLMAPEPWEKLGYDGPPPKDDQIPLPATNASYLQPEDVTIEQKGGFVAGVHRIQSRSSIQKSSS